MALLTITRKDFINKYENENTRKQIRNSFHAFDAFLEEINTQEPDLIQNLKRFAKSEDEDEKTEIYRILDKMQLFWTKDKHPNTIKAYFNYIRLWLQYNGLRIESFQIKNFIKFPKPIRSRPIPITREVIQKLLENSPLKYKCYILLTATAGPRGIKEMLGLKIKDIDFKMNPTKLTIPGEIAKNGIERITFLTPEATELLKEYVKDRESGEKIFDFTYAAVQWHISQLRDTVGMTGKMANGKFHHLRIHKFRKFCETNISNSQIPGTESDEFAHAILGHEKYLMTYYEVPEKEMAKMYSSAIPKLTISENQRLKDENGKLKEKNDEIDQMKEKFAVMEAKLARMELTKKVI